MKIENSKTALDIALDLSGSLTGLPVVLSQLPVGERIGFDTLPKVWEEVDDPGQSWTPDVTGLDVDFNVPMYNQLGADKAPYTTDLNALRNVSEVGNAWLIDYYYDPEEGDIELPTQWETGNIGIANGLMQAIRLPNTGRIIIGMRATTGTEGSIVMSDNDMKTFLYPTITAYGNVYSFAISDEGYITAVSSFGLYISKDNGDNWEEVPRLISISDHVYINGRYVLVSDTGTSVYIVEDLFDLSDWRQVTSSVFEEYRPMYNMRLTGERIWGGIARFALLYSDDYGETWNIYVPENRSVTFTIPYAPLLKGTEYIVPYLTNCYITSDLISTEKVTGLVQIAATSSYLNGAYSRGILIYGTRDGAYSISRNGRNWFRIQTDITEHLTSVIYLSRGRFLVIGENGSFVIATGNIIED